MIAVLLGDSSHDFLYGKSFDTISLGQWRMRGSYTLSRSNEIGITSTLRSYTIREYLARTLPSNFSRSISSFSTIVAFGELCSNERLLDRTSPTSMVKTTPSLVHPLQKNYRSCLVQTSLCLSPRASQYTAKPNMITPSDTGTVDAFLGIQWSPKRRTNSYRRSKFSPLLPLAAPTSFAVDLLQDSTLRHGSSDI